MYYVLTCLAALISRLSPNGLSRLASFCAWLLFDVVHLRRDLMLRNLKRAFPDKSDSELARIGKLSVYNFSLTILEFLHSYKSDIAEHVELRGTEHIRAALDEGRGVYILCFHMGSWEAMGAACTRQLTPSYVLVKRVGSPSVDRFVSEIRQKNGFLTVQRRKKGDGYIGIKEVLGRGEIIGFVMDQARPGEPKLPFFGEPAQTNTSLAAIWRRVPAPIVPSYARRTGVGRHVVEFLPALKVTSTGDEASDILRQSTEFNAVVEHCVRLNPEQYFWMHNRWK